MDEVFAESLLKIYLEMGCYRLHNEQIISQDRRLTPDWLTLSEAADSEQLYTLQTRHVA